MRHHPLPCAVLLMAAALLPACQSEAERQQRDSPIPFARFNEADVNHDGKLDREEAQSLPELTKYFDRLDNRAFQSWFDRVDTDNSGYLSWVEMRAARFPAFRVPRITK